MLANKTLKQLNSKLIFLTAVVVCFFTGNAAVAQSSNNKPRPEARLITTVTSKDVKKPASADANHPKAVSSSPERESAAPRPKAVLDAIASFSSTSLEKRTLDLINRERQKYGYAPLVFDPELCLVARMYSEKMAAKDFFSHIGPDGNDVQGRARSFGVRRWKAIGENLAFNQGYDDPVGFAVERWMISPSHRSNILLAMWTATGIGIAKSEDDSYYITQVFISR